MNQGLEDFSDRTVCNPIEIHTDILPSKRKICNPERRVGQLDLLRCVLHPWPSATLSFHHTNPQISNPRIFRPLYWNVMIKQQKPAPAGRAIFNVNRLPAIPAMQAGLCFKRTKRVGGEINIVDLTDCFAGD